MGIVLTTYVIWMLGSIRLVPFTRLSSTLIVLGMGIIVWGIDFLKLKATHPHRLSSALAGTATQSSKLGEFKGESSEEGKVRKIEAAEQVGTRWKLIVIEEFLFLLAFGGWAWVRASNPDIRGLEKFMDYGFMLSALRGNFFPPLDHFLAGETINYYYFGHLISAVLTRLSGVAPAAGYNLQIANLFALTFLESFIIGYVLFYKSVVTNLSSRLWGIASGLLASLFVTVIGNLHLAWEYILGRSENYWYAAASRVIPYTINEFPVYSFIVADLHGHVSDLPIVLLFLGVLISFFIEWLGSEACLAQSSMFKAPARLEAAASAANRARQSHSEKRKAFSFKLSFCPPARLAESKRVGEAGALRFALCAFLLGTMYVTNSWDFAIYGMVLGIVMFFLYYRERLNLWRTIWDLILPLGSIVGLSVIFFLPFWLTVKPISQGIGLVRNLSSPKHILILWGFYLFLSLVYGWWLFREKIKKFLRVESVVTAIAGLLGVRVKVVGGEDEVLEESQKHALRSSLSEAGSMVNGHHVKRGSLSDAIALLFLLCALILLILPEIVYLKDIYQPDYYRANTMFKLYYQAWVLFALATAYGTTRVIYWLARRRISVAKIMLFSFYLLLFTVVICYPYVAVKTVAGGVKAYRGLDGNYFLQEAFPDDAEAIVWFNENIKGQPVILEAVGESYTDYSRICGNTGLPAVLGWPIHEWLWRGGWDIPGQRQEDVRQIYEGGDDGRARELLVQYEVEYVYVGKMEREKYPQLKQERFADWGEIVFENGEARIYRRGGDVE